MAKTRSKKTTRERDSASSELARVSKKSKNSKISRTSKGQRASKKKERKIVRKMRERWRKICCFARRKFPKTARKIDLARERRELRKKERIHPHRSFRRSYREDYRRDLEIPGIMYHIFATFRAIFKNWKLFLPLTIIAVVLNVVLVGLMSESTYTQFQDALDETNEMLAGGDLGAVPKAGLLLLSSITTGGLADSDSEAGPIFLVIIFLMLWLVTIFLLRQRLAGNKVKLRDGLYNAMTPLVPTFLVFATAMIQCIPIFLLVITYSAAVTTDFLATPFYALVYFIFAALMVLLSGYLLSSSLVAMVAVSAPGLWPLKALQASSDIMMGRRVRFILRLVALILALALIWVVVMIPIILIDLGLKEAFDWLGQVPIVPICLNVMLCFTMIYVTAYLYIYYRWLLDYEEK